MLFPNMFTDFSQKTPRYTNNRGETRDEGGYLFGVDRGKYSLR